jgi:nitrogen fixation NifU-like protein
MSDDHASNPAVLDHFLHPRNVGDLPEADGVGEVGAAACGDVVRISIRVADDRIAEARFRTYGCGTAIACSSMATELIRGRTLDEAARLSAADVSAAFGGLPATKAHCPVLAEEAVKAAVIDCRQRRAGGTIAKSGPKGPA